MKLLIDFGNSRVKWGSLDVDESLQFGGAINYHGESLDQKICNIVAGLPIHLCCEINAVSVLGEKFNHAFMQNVLNEFHVQTIFHFSQNNAFNVKLAYADPTTYGADRYAALIAAAHTEEGAKIIVDAGTAVTIDAITKDHIHLGGVIFPGLSAMCSALDSADGIGKFVSSTNIEYLSKTTQSAVYSGSALCLHHGIEGIVREIMKTMGGKAVILLTGGASNLLKELANDYVMRPHLVLTGIGIMQRN